MFKFSDGILSSAAANRLLLPRVLPIIHLTLHSDLPMPRLPLTSRPLRDSSSRQRLWLWDTASSFRFQSSNHWCNWCVRNWKARKYTQDPKTAYILTTTVQLRSGCGRLGTMVAPGNSALKAMHNGEWHHHQLYLRDKKRHEWSWDVVSGHILTKIGQVSCSVDTSCVCIDMFLSLDSWLSSTTWLPRGHVRLPPSRRSPWGIDLVPGCHVIMSCHGPNISLPKVEKHEKNLLDSNPVV